MSKGSRPGWSPALVAEPSRRAISCSPLNDPLLCMIFSAQSAAKPATWGVAMLVPLLDANPPPALADLIATPGAATFAPVFENGATVSPCACWPRAATEMMPSATAIGGLPLLGLGLWRSPAASAVVELLLTLAGAYLYYRSAMSLPTPAGSSESIQRRRALTASAVTAGLLLVLFVTSVLAI